MKVVILAGGFGTRISEESVVRPKPMIEVGGRPILWHIMKIFSSHGINDFVICLGYKGYFIKEYFANYYLHMSDVTFDMSDNSIEVHHEKAEPWKVTLVDTGDETMTGGRLKRVQDYVGDDDFCFTYGDGVADVDISRLIDFHNSHGCIATVTAIQPPGRFGTLTFKDNEVISFEEKPKEGSGWINGGFFVLKPEVFDYIDGDDTVWEQEPLKKLSKEKNLQVFRHEGFWSAMDTLRDKNYLESLWTADKAPWKGW